jgi:hypothetical protein
MSTTVDVAPLHEFFRRTTAAVEIKSMRPVLNDNVRQIQHTVLRSETLCRHRPDIEMEQRLGDTGIRGLSPCPLKKR